MLVPPSPSPFWIHQSSPHPKIFHQISFSTIFLWKVIGDKFLKAVSSQKIPSLYITVSVENDRRLKKVNHATNAIEHWDIYFTFVITTCCFNNLTARKWYNHFPFACTPLPLLNTSILTSPQNISPNFIWAYWKSRHAYLFWFHDFVTSQETTLFYRYIMLSKLTRFYVYIWIFVWNNLI